MQFVLNFLCNKVVLLCWRSPELSRKDLASSTTLFVFVSMDTEHCSPCIYSLNTIFDDSWVNSGAHLKKSAYNG
jgi:hypothetical protein